MIERKRAVIYIRVSTDEQAEKGYSLKLQEEVCKKYCDFHNIEVVALFKEDFSAKTFERPEWKNMMRQLKSRQLKTDWVIFQKWDRFSRNTTQAYVMIDKLADIGIEVQATDQPLNLKIPEQRLILAFYLSYPEVENKRRALNVKTNMRLAKKKGRWMATAPKGYSNVTDATGTKKFIEPNKDAPLIIWAFEELATGLTTVIDVLRRANKKGLNCSRNNFWKLIRNPIYCGKIPIPAEEDEEAHLVQGQHEPLISEELFYRVQDILDGRRRNVPTKNTAKDELPLRGYLICRRCGSNLTGSASTGKLGGKYFYYHCKKGCDERFKALEANRLFEDGLKSLTVKKEAIDLYYLAVKKAFSVNKNSQVTNIASIKREIVALQQKVDKARDMMLDDKIEASDFKEIKAGVQPKIEKLTRQLNSQTSIEGDYKAFIDEGFGMLRNLSETYSQADLQAKQQIVGSIFPEKLIFENNQYRTPRLLFAFSRILSNNAASKGNKNGTEVFYLPQSHLVIPLGFEPRTPTLKV